MYRKRYYDAPEGSHKAGDIVSVFGWYDRQAWEHVKLVGTPTLQTTHVIRGLGREIVAKPTGWERWAVERVDVGACQNA